MYLAIALHVSFLPKYQGDTQSLHTDHLGVLTIETPVHNVTKCIWKYETATAEIKCARYFALVIDS